MRALVTSSYDPTTRVPSGHVCPRLTLKLGARAGFLRGQRLSVRIHDHDYRQPKPGGIAKPLVDFVIVPVVHVNQYHDVRLLELGGNLRVGFT